MNDMLLKMLASQLQIPSAVIDEAKSAKIELFSAGFDDGVAHVVLKVQQPGAASFPVSISLPVEQLQRVPALYDRVLKAAYKGDALCQ